MLDSMILAMALHAPTDRSTTPHPTRSAPRAAVQFLRCVIKHESGGDPKAENGGTRGSNAARGDSTASGLFQFIDGTWVHYNRKLKGVKQYAHAADAPAVVQWQAALLAVKWGGHGHWKGTNCGYGT